jgi:hypothetical protein
MAEVHRSPGFYPAPDRRGEQWWNGVSWSETRRNAATGAPTPVQPLIPIAAQAQRNRPNTAATLAFVLGLIGLAFPWAAIAAIIVAFLGFRRGPFGAGSRFVAFLGLILGIIGAIALFGEDAVQNFLS